MTLHLEAEEMVEGAAALLLGLFPATDKHKVSEGLAQGGGRRPSLCLLFPRR